MIRIRGVPISLRIPGLLLILLVALSVARYWEVSRVEGARVALPGLEPRPELLVDVAWLRDHLNDPGLRIVDLRAVADYRRGHVPGAVFFASDDLRAVVNGISGMLPPLPRVEVALRQAGIGADTVVVAYDAVAGLMAARLFWVLDYLGQGNGRLLDGGWPAWAASGFATSTEVPSVLTSDFRADPQPEKIADLAWMRNHLGREGVVYVDARSPEEYAGTRVYARRGGHIPGAVSLEWKRHLSGGRFRDATALAAAYRKLGVTPDKTVAVYCQSLVRASHTYFTLKWLGFPDVRGYDGSWAEWGNRDDTPVETGPPPVARAPAAPAAPPTEASGALRPGISLEDARRLLGEPTRVELQNPCWGELAVWHYAARGSQGPLRLTFVDGKLREIERGP